MKRPSIALCALALFVSPVAWAETPEKTTGAENAAPAAILEVEGNWVMPLEVYRTVAGLEPGSVADAQTAKQVEERLLTFLRDSGYRLAAVRVEARDGVLQAKLNEGKVEKVVFRGKLTLKSLRLKLALALPHEVFNDLLLDRELARLSKEIGIDAVWYRLVPTREVEHFGWQLENLGTLQGHALIPRRQPYELHIFLSQHEWNTGLGLDIRSGFSYGLEVGLHYQHVDLLLPDDRWRVAGSGGATVRSRAITEELYPAFSRTQGEIRWYTPPVVWERFRPFVWARAELTSRQRPDLNLESYLNAAFDGSIHAQQELAPGLSVSFGGGVKYQNLFSFTPVVGLLPPTDLDLATEDQLRTFFLLRTELLFESGEARADRRHELVAESRYFVGVRFPDYGLARYEYQKVFPIGWHDIWLRSSGAFLWGDVPFNDEVPVSGRHVRGVFRNLFYVRKVASVSAEFHFSITREVYRIGVFHDLALWAQLDRGNIRFARESFVLGNSFGPSFHALIEDMFQLDIYVSFGFTRNFEDRSKDDFDSGLTVRLRKVF